MEGAKLHVSPLPLCSSKCQTSDSCALRELFVYKAPGVLLNSGLISVSPSRCIKTRPYFHRALTARAFLNQTYKVFKVDRAKSPVPAEGFAM